MSASTQASVRPSQQRGSPRGAREWLDALSNGECSQEEVQRALDKLSESGTDAACSMLATLDQYYRRRIISSEQFYPLKSRLAGKVFGAEEIAEISVPMPPAVARSVVASRATPTIHGQTPAAAAALPATGVARVPAVGDVLRGRYLIEAVLGHGGMGSVLRAIDQDRVGLQAGDRRVALKVLNARAAAQPGMSNELRRQFQRLQSLSHPNIVRVHEFDRDADLPFFTMELLQGVSLSRLLDARNGSPFDRSHALAIIRDVGAAVAHAHSRGVTHGDIKPQNIFVTDDGDIRVLDFGAANLPLSEPTISDVELSLDTPMATPAYASCQVLLGQRAEVADDVYSLACVGYMLLAGQHPFQRRTAIDARARRMSPRRPAGLTRSQWQALRAGLCWDAARRPSDVRKWLERLDLRAAAPQLPPPTVLVAGSPPTRGLLTFALLATSFTLLLAIGLWMSVDQNSVSGQFATLRTDLRQALAGAGAYLSSMGNGTQAGATAGDATMAGPVAAPAVRALQASPAASKRSRAHAPESGMAPAPVASAAIAPPADAAGNADAAATIAPARLELAADTIEASATEPLARVIVHRRGNLHGEASFVWWTESGSAKAGDDFASFGARVARIDAGNDNVELLIPIVSDPTRRQPRSFYVVIGGAGPGVALGSQTRSLVRIPPAL